MTRLGAQAYPHLSLLLHVFIIVEDRIALTIIYKSPNSRFSLLLVIVGLFELEGVHWVVAWLLLIFNS